MKYKTVIFDMDGTLLDTAQGVMNAVRYSLDKMDLPHPQNLTTSFVIGPPLHSTYKKLIGPDLEQINMGVNLQREYYGSKGLYEAKPYPGIMELLEELKKAKVNICIATAKYKIMAEKMFDHYNLRQYICHAEMSNGKETTNSKQAMVAAVLKHTKSSPEQSVMIGDTCYDTDGAIKNNVDFIGVLYGYGCKESMERSGAKYFANNVTELHELLKK